MHGVGPIVDAAKIGANNQLIQIVFRAFGGRARELRVVDAGGVGGFHMHQTVGNTAGVSGETGLHGVDDTFGEIIRYGHRNGIAAVV